MALVKTSKMPAAEAKPKAPPPPPAIRVATAPEAVPRNRVRSVALPRHEQAAERIAAATQQLASGLIEASAAAEELRRSMEQIASGAEEAAGTSQEQLAAIKNMVDALTAARNAADLSRRRTDNVQIILAETAVQITTCVRAIEKSAQRQQGSVTVIAELERRAQDIREISSAVSRISDQTNLLALNAAIEAARAGDHGRGFAVVAEEVRALAETSEKSAQEVQSLAETIQRDVREIVQAVNRTAETAATQAKAGASVIESLDAMRLDMERIAEGSRDTQSAAIEAERSVTEVQRGAEQVASAAEEQASAAAEAQSAIREQGRSLEHAQQAAAVLAGVSDQLRAGRVDAATTQQIGANSDELSATIQELSSTASEIAATIVQITRGSQQQASATHETSAALAQIEKSAALARTQANLAQERVRDMDGVVKESRRGVDALVTHLADALQETQSRIATIGSLENVGRRIDKTVDGIALVAIQTSMLAVSGAVEAARAGESGRGFATVSNDIRSLAREASESVDRIKDTVRGIIDQIASVRRDLELMLGSAESELERNRAIFGALDKIDADVASLAQANTAILRGADDILGAVTESAAGAHQIAAAAEEANTAAAQAATASNEQARGAQDLAAAIEEIASLVSELNRSNG